MEITITYDHTDPSRIEEYAKRLIGHTFQEVLDWSDTSDKSTDDTYGKSSRKGGLGNLLEEKYFGYKANSNSEADFHEAGVELKASPYEG